MGFAASCWAAARPRIARFAIVLRLANASAPALAAPRHGEGRHRGTDRARWPCRDSTRSHGGESLAGVTAAGLGRGGSRRAGAPSLSHTRKRSHTSCSGCEAEHPVAQGRAMRWAPWGRWRTRCQVGGAGGGWEMGGRCVQAPPNSKPYNTKLEPSRVPATVNTHCSVLLSGHRAPALTYSDPTHGDTAVSHCAGGGLPPKHPRRMDMEVRQGGGRRIHT
jgi:hypothetical protein